MRNRSNLEIISEILKVCMEPIKKTRIMNKCNMSYEMLSNYLDVCIINEFVSKVELEYMDFKGNTYNDGNGYLITNKGRVWLTEYNIVRSKITI